MAKCTNCGKTIIFGGTKENGNPFCSSVCKNIFQTKNKEFCSQCLNETYFEPMSSMSTYNGIGTSMGVFKRKKCPECGSFIKRKWFFIVFPIIPYANYRLFESKVRKKTFGGTEQIFKVRRLKIKDRECLSCGYHGQMKSWFETSIFAHLITIVLLGAFIIPGIIFIVWGKNKYRCPSCSMVGNNHDGILQEYVE